MKRAAKISRCEERDWRRAGVSSRAAFGAGPSVFKQAFLKALGPAPKAARDDTPALRQSRSSQQYWVFIPLLFISLLPLTALAAEKKIVNVYVWTGEVPDFAVRNFEKETGIKVNFSTYENNEIMYAKMRTSKDTGYDLIMPSSYFVDRMAHQDMLEKIDQTKLTNLKNLNPDFAKPAYDPALTYSVPYIWGIAGIFVNSRYFKPDSISKWTDLWEERFDNQLLMLDDTREVFSMALLSLGYSANDRDPEHIKAAFLKLKSLSKNIKVFSTDTVISIMIDEDAEVGMAWNADAYKAARENKDIHFIYPQEGFVVWVDNFAIPKNAKHKEEAYAFINYILRPDVARDIALANNFPTTNLAAFKLLPADLRNDTTVYPPENIVRKATFLTDIGDDALALYAQYWAELKMNG
jgi:spermidine/putrescine transport system substrate-binding protein